MIRNEPSMEERDLAAVLHPTTNFRRLQDNGPLYFERAKGVFVYDPRGRDYIEGLSGLWCTALGYGVEELADAAREEMLKLSFSHLFGGRTHETAVALAEKLKEIAPVPVGKVFFGCSGSDANDTQIKLQRYYNNAIGRPQKKKILSRRRGYHGVTIGSGSLTGIPVNHALFDLPIDGVIHVSPPYAYREAHPGESSAAYADRLIDEIKGVIEREGPETIAAFVAEPVMGVGGVLVPPDGYFPKLRALLTEHDIMLIDDEVICGFWRTGKRFGAEAVGMQPDTMTLAKALSSAYLPISATLVPERMYEAMIEPSDANGAFGHGFTYGGHPVSCAVALKTLELMERWRIGEHVAKAGAHFQNGLRAFADHPLAGDVRGVGLVSAIELVSDRKTKAGFGKPGAAGLVIEKLARDNGLIIRPLGDTIAFCPPLVITEAEIDEMFRRFARALNAATEQLRPSA
ncbi:MAG: aminotransferase [Pseudomonadota bacterium]|nr:aminotransferase [Pseudomonadota bacterium]